MARYKLELDKFPYSEMESHTAESGQRVYYTPAGPAPSVTTILSTLPNPELDAWRERVGEEEANRVSKEATTIGSYMHDMLENTLKGEEIVRDGSDLETMAAEMFQAVRLFGWKKLERVWGVEVPLHYDSLYAGRTDLVGVYDGKPSIMDYKTSKFHKAPEHIEKYKLQMAAYKTAHEHMYPGVVFEQGVLFFSIRPNKQYGKRAQSNVVVVGKDEMEHYQEMWVEILENYYA